MNELTAWAIFGSGVLSGVVLTFVVSLVFSLVLGGLLFFRADEVPDKIEGAQ